MPDMWRFLDPTDYPRWNAFLADSPQGSLFQSTPYLAARGVRFSVLVHEREREILAGIVLARNSLGLATNPLFVKHLGVAFAPFAGSSVARQSARRKALHALLPALAHLRSFDYAFAPTFDDWLPFYWAGYRQQTNYTYRIGTGAAARWREAADHRMRNDEKRALRHGVRVAETGAHETLVALVTATYRRRGARPPMTETALRAFLAGLRAADMLVVLEARDADGRVCAASGLVQDARTAYLLLSGYANEAPAGSTTLLLAEAVERTHRTQRVFDFEGSMIRPIEAYYRGFGGLLTPYFRIWRPSLLNGTKAMASRTAKKLLNYAR